MKKFVTKTSAPHMVCKDGFTKPSRATSASESPTIMSVMDIPTNWRRWRLLRGAVKQKSAFTLAEVLITLGIIGIVSALTLPVLMQNINGHKYRTQFKKSFSTLSQAVKLAQEAYELSFAMLDQTCEQTGSDANPRTSRSMCALLNGTLKGASYVGQASEIYGNKDIKIGDYPISDYLVYRLSDGSLVGFYKNLKTCTVPTGTQLTESVLTGSGALKNCLGFIDVNGDKNPNDLVQGTSADSISWLFGMPTAFGYGDYDTSCGDEYCYDARGNFCCGINCTDEYTYTEADLKYNAQGQRGIGDEYIYNESDVKYNGKISSGTWERGVGDEYIYNYNPGNLRLNSKGQWGVGDGYIYTSSELDQGKYNAQGLRGVGDGFIYSYSDLKYNGKCFPPYDSANSCERGVGEEFIYNSSDIKYSGKCEGSSAFSCERGVGEEFIYANTKNFKYNAQGDIGIGDEYVYSSSQIKCTAHGKRGIGDEYIYKCSDLKYNANCEKGIGDEYIYSSITKTPNIREAYALYNDGDITAIMLRDYSGRLEGMINLSDIVSCDKITSVVFSCKLKSGENKIISASGYRDIFNSKLGNNNIVNELNGVCSASSFDATARCRVPNRSGFISDIFPIVFHDGVVEPASGPARAVLHQAK